MKKYVLIKLLYLILKEIQYFNLKGIVILNKDEGHYFVIRKLDSDKFILIDGIKD